MILTSSYSCRCPTHWSQVLSREWRCSWSSADRRCSNYIWVINNLIAYRGASYIRDLTVYKNVGALHYNGSITEEKIYCNKLIFVFLLCKKYSTFASCFFSVIHLMLKPIKYIMILGNVLAFFQCQIILYINYDCHFNTFETWTK